MVPSLYPIRIVVVGSGFGGVGVVAKLARLFLGDGAVAITLISPVDHMLFTPLLHEVAMGMLSPEGVSEPLSRILPWPSVTLVEGMVRLVLTKDNRVVLQDDREIAYDYLVIATGAATNYFNIPGAEEHSLALKTEEDALVIRDRLIGAFRHAAKTRDTEEQRRLLSFVIVGGGPTGVECAAELVDYARYGLLPRYGRSLADKLSILVINRGPSLIPMFPEKFQERAKRHLERMGILVLTSTGVISVTDTEVVLDTGGHRLAGTVIWAAGVRPDPPAFDVVVETVRGSIQVDRFLRLSGHNDIYVLGDVAHFVNDGETNRVPMLAQVASRQAPVVARNIARAIRGQALTVFRFTPQGLLLSIGEWMAIAQIKRFYLVGRLAWLLWRGIYLMKLNSHKDKLIVVRDWARALFGKRYVE